MGLNFGTSGVRGLVSEFTDREAYLLTTAFIQHAENVQPTSSVAIGLDLRESSPKIFQAVVRALTDLNKSVLNCGVLPTPALAYYAAGKGAMAIMITGSHIPADRNGIKFYLKSGETLKSDDAKIFQNYQNLQAENYKNELFQSSGEFHDILNTKSINNIEEANQTFKNRYLNFFPNSPLNGKKVLFYEHSSCARKLLGEILEGLGANVIRLGASQTFIPVDTEAVESLEQFKLWIKDYQADILVSTDGDGDRPLVVDNLGRLVQGDKLGMICAQYLGVEAVALPISCNSGISQIESFKKIQFTKIGSPYVIEALNNLSNTYKSVAGFEANGGFILSSSIEAQKTLESLPTRDSVLPILSILVAAKIEGKSVAELVDNLPKRFTSSVLIKNCPPTNSKEIIEIIKNDALSFLYQVGIDDAISDINTIDGIRIITTKQQIIHLRPSGNAPEFRCYTESNTSEVANTNAEKCKAILTSLLGI